MKICTETMTLATKRKSSVFFSCNGSRVSKKMKVCSINFIWAYMGDHRKVNSKHRPLSKRVKSFLLETNLMKKNNGIYFLISCRCRSLCKFLCLDPVQQRSYIFLTTHLSKYFAILSIGRK